MISLFEIGVNILEMFIVLMFLTLYFGSKYKRIKAVAGFILSLIVTVAIITYLNTLYIYEAFLGLIFAALYFTYCVLLLKGDIGVKLFMSGFINCIVYSLALFSILCASLLPAGDINSIFGFTSTRLYLIALGKTLLIIICLILLKFRVNYVAKKSNMLLFIIMPVITEISTVGIMQIYLKHNELNTELFLVAIGIMLTNFLIYYLFIKTNRDLEKASQLALLRQKVEIDKKNAQDIENLYIKTCGIHHDLVTHFSAISKLLEESSEKAQEYINTIMNNQLSFVKTLIKTENDCFDAIANTKIALCEKYNIRCIIRVMKNSLDTLRDDEIAVLFGNLFDNAIEASKNSQRKSIKLDVQQQDRYLSVFMKNSIDKSVLGENKNLNTTKSDKKNHGFGIKNIKRVVDRYNGIIQYYEKDNYFICDILIPKQPQPKKILQKK